MGIGYQPGEALTCQQIRELDILAIEHVGIPGLVLMENAARAVSEFIYGRLFNPSRAAVVALCGPGNNGGDGLAVARQLRNAGVAVTVVLAGPPDKFRGDAATNLAIYQRLEAPLIDARDERGLAQCRAVCASADVIVDALLGTGAGGPPRGTIAELVRIANDCPRARRVAVDIPTGLDADEGTVSEPCLRADATVTFVARKIGFDAPAARPVLGEVIVADIGVPRNLIPGLSDCSRSG